MEATSENGDVWTGEQPVEGWWPYRDKSGRLYESREVPCYRLQLNAKLVAGGIAPLSANLKRVDVAVRPYANGNDFSFHVDGACDFAAAAIAEVERRGFKLGDVILKFSEA